MTRKLSPEERLLVAIFGPDIVDEKCCTFCQRQTAMPCLTSDQCKRCRFKETGVPYRKSVN